MSGIVIRDDNPFICHISCQCGMRWKFSGPEACQEKLKWHAISVACLYDLFEVLTKLDFGDFRVGFKDEVKGHLIADALDAEMSRVFR